MNEAKVGVVLGAVGIVLFFAGWAIDRSELMGRSLRGRPRALVSIPRRREVKRMTGNYKVPTLVLDDGTIVDGSQNIIDWAQANEAAGLSE